MTDVDLYDVLKAGYKDKNKQEHTLKKFGYERDKSLSSENHQAYYNPTNKKLVFNVSGTHSISDWATDAYLGAGHLKDTTRYKEADKMLKKAKEKYKPENTSVVGHSLGGSIAGYISSKNDNVYTLDKGATIGQKVRNNEHAYRTSGDIVSALNVGSKHMTTLKNPNLTTGVLPIDILNSHNVDNIKNKSIFV
jgi:hypothetical protein